MDDPAGMPDLASVSFAEGEVSCFPSFRQQVKHSLDLSLGQKSSENLFAADQTPTPTRLIKNCDEVGLFEDLQHVNPFDIGFQRAAEQNVSGSTPSRPEAPPIEGESLHTPQVYPMEAPAPGNSGVTRSDSCSNVDVEQLLASTGVTSEQQAEAEAGPPPLQLIQPQVITWVLPAQSINALPPADSQRSKTSVSSTSRPYILPKPSSRSSGSASRRPDPILVSCNPPQPAPEPSSASLTPTSQLPIKERLKAILHSNNSSNRRHFSAPSKPTKPKDRSRDEDCMERRRAAASRYRNKMRNEHKDLRQQNAQLQQENRELLERIARLERELQQHKSQNSLADVMANQLQIPPSSIHLLINMPNVLVPSPADRK
ncbi:cyclic AMP-dependent transcription factor ATF-2 [Drosophila kikkawai]|uniref:Cyclic AMP-dependent transcription factor ATF-2 n=1 Tax=Drosophila kikkawai TaxID=30033 RepID=A0A6P4I8Q3_DROKI|nr:cyclic AMP-dependent transcription factor ATF-2 [Drosophila kikkawai]